MGKTQVWNAAGDRPPACNLLERIAQASDPEGRVWKGSGVPLDEHRGSPFWALHWDIPHCMQAFLRRVTVEHEVLLSRIPLVEDVQSAWALLLHCAGGRANFMLRAVSLRWSVVLVVDMSVLHFERCGRWRLPRCGPGRLGIEGRSVDHPAFWASWADCIAMVRARHLDVVALIIRAMRDTGLPTLVSAQTVAHQLVGVEGFGVANGRPPRRKPGVFEPGGCRHGRQHEAASQVERQHRGRLMPRLPQQQRAMLRSQSGPLAGVPLLTTPCNLSRINSHLFRVLLLRRLRLPLPLSARQCRCGRPLDTFGHHHTSCARTGVLGRRGKVLGRTYARKQEAESQRRVEILVDGLPLFGRAQLAVDTMLVSPLHCDGSPRPRTANEDVLCRRHVSGRREHIPSLWDHVAGLGVVLAGKVGGPYSNTHPRLKNACRRGFRRLMAPRDPSIHHTFMFS